MTPVLGYKPSHHPDCTSPPMCFLGLHSGHGCRHPLNGTEGSDPLLTHKAQQVCSDPCSASLHCPIPVTAAPFWGVPHRAACGILVPDQGSNPRPRQRKCRILTTGPPGKSLDSHNSISRGSSFSLSSHPYSLSLSITMSSRVLVKAAGVQNNGLHTCSRKTSAPHSLPVCDLRRWVKWAADVRHLLTRHCCPGPPSAPLPALL